MTVAAALVGFSIVSMALAVLAAEDVLGAALLGAVGSVPIVWALHRSIRYDGREAWLPALLAALVAALPIAVALDAFGTPACREDNWTCLGAGMAKGLALVLAWTAGAVVLLAALVLWLIRVRWDGMRLNSFICWFAAMPLLVFLAAPIARWLV